MSNKKRSVLLRAPGLVVLLALLLATAGLVYAHWTTTLNVDGQIQTGGVGVAWFDAWTNDDGVANGNDAENVASPAYDAWGLDSSADPATPSGYDEGVNPVTPGRYDKDVARCWAQADGNSNLQLQIDGAYPSYHCMFTAVLGGQGNVPVRATAIDFAASKDYQGFCTDDQGQNPYMGGAPINWDDGGPFADEGGESGVFDNGDIRLWDCHINAALDVRPGPNEGNFAFGFPGEPDEIVGDISAGVRCGTQVDPVPCHWEFGDNEVYEGSTYGDDQGRQYANEGDRAGQEVYQVCDLTGAPETSGWLHVEQDASQNAQYRFNLSQEFVNWNEWDVSMCSIGAVVDMDGDPSTPPDGYIDGSGNYVPFP